MPDGKAKFEKRIGTSGWHYNHWQKRFYPGGLPKNKWLLHYAQTFDSVEINNTFYQLPKPATIERWYTQASEDFRYAVKANRYITHIKKLRNPVDEIQRFLTSVEVLKEKLGPILFQLPPGLHQDIGLLGDFLKLLPGQNQKVFEFRHKSWYEEGTFELLKEFNTAFCIHDMPGAQTPKVLTADFVYIRFHGQTERYSSSYSDRALREWAEWIQDNAGKIKAVYAYFNNDAEANAVKNAKRLKKLLVGI
jgi:uncharacterized protein YecE (DUF72 family)